MKNTRKKMLLSSIAMLLVALVALGSATYAWYITNATVTADETQFSAASADGLVIRHKTSDDWTTAIHDLNKASVLTPASIDYANGSTVVGATGKGTSFTDGTLSGDLSEVPVTQNGATGGYFLVDTFYVASSGASPLENVSFTVKCGTVANTYMNLAIYVDNELKTVLTSDPTEGWTSTSKIDKSGTSITTSGSQTLTKMANMEVAKITAATKDSNGTAIKV
ncbi:MAG: hypothetical protein J1E41_05150, partial [Ruminococcus sp.]|nr:hypothetical protein [Ruminococcus sp.]